jgi:hypothetical protein
MISHLTILDHKFKELATIHTRNLTLIKYPVFFFVVLTSQGLL